MLDTVRIFISPIVLDVKELERRKFQKITHSNLVDEDSASSPYATKTVYIRRNENFSPHFIKYDATKLELIVETSLPKVIFKQNISLLSDLTIASALDELSNRIEHQTGAVLPHVSTWLIRGRADFCFAWDVRVGKRDYTRDYLAALRAVSVPRMHSESLERAGTQYWFNGNRRVRFYDKFRETKDQLALGLCRLEIQLNHSKKELSRHGVGCTLGAIANWETARMILQEWLAALTLDHPISGQEVFARRLIEAIKPSAARRILGTVMFRQIFTPSQLELMGFPKSLMSKDLADLGELNISQAMSETQELPALVLPNSFDGSAGKIE